VKSDLGKKLAQLPDQPGIYQMLAEDGSVLYVGKAISLRKRVRSYFSGRPDRAKTALLLTRVRDIEVILTKSEVEALLLENNLIKQYRPPFNVELKDDKQYPYVRLDSRQAFPRFELVRRRRRDGARYFGPFPAVAALRGTLAVLNRHFRLRRCRGERFANRVRPCLNFQMNLCSGPCCGRVSELEYRRRVGSAALILGGRGRSVLLRLERRMRAAAEKLDFERAAEFRDALADLRLILENQAIDAGRDEDLDVIGMAVNVTGACALYLLTIRRGNVVGGRPFSFPAYGGVPDDLPSAFLQRYYGAEGEIYRPPPVIVLPAVGEFSAGLEAWLEKIRGGRVKLVAPQRGRRLKLLELACRNAQEHLGGQVSENDFPVQALAAIAQFCQLKSPPEMIEGLDISNLQDQGVVAALVTFRGGVPFKEGYRHYRLAQAPPDDFARMAEVVRRRFAAEKERLFPDLLVLDGGLAQLEAVARVLRELNVEIPLLAIAKGRNEKGVRDRHEPDHFFGSGHREPWCLSVFSPAYRLLQQVRDEAHRFAVTYHRQVRKKERDTSLLEVEGIGRKRALTLLRMFGSLEELRQASPEVLVSRARLPLATARRLHEFLCNH